MVNFLRNFLERQLEEQKDELREFIRELVDEDKLDLAVSIHNKYIKEISTSMSLFAKIVLDATTREEIRSYFSLVSAYIIEPGNYLRKSIPETAQFIDNAYVLHSSLEIVIKHLDESKKKEYSEQLEILKPIFEYNQIIRNIIPEYVTNRQDVIINYLEKLLDVKASVKEHSIYVMPPV